MPELCKPPDEGREVIARWTEAMRFTPDLDDRAALLSLLGNATRLKIVFLLAELKQVCVCDLAEVIGVSQSAVSQHLAKFRAHRLVTHLRDGQTLYYRLASTPEAKLLRRLALSGIEPPAIERPAIER